jgi:hypothetical protein
VPFRIVFTDKQRVETEDFELANTAREQTMGICFDWSGAAR